MGEKKEPCSFDDEAALVKAFGLYAVYRSQSGGYRLTKGGVEVGTFAEARIEEERVLFTLSHGTLLEVSDRGRREILSPSKATLCGLIASDGGNHSYLYYLKDKGKYRLSHRTYFCSTDKELIEAFDRLFLEVYNKGPHHYSNGDGKIRSMVFDKGVFYDLNDFGVKTGPFRFHVPIEHLDEEGLRAYLRGFFSGDGNISKSGTTFIIRVYSKHREQLDELQKAFINAGIRVSELHSRERSERAGRGKGIDRWFTIYKADHIKFINEIGSLNPNHIEKFEIIKSGAYEV